MSDNACSSHLDSCARVDVFICDSGLDISHPEFGGRARVGFNAIGYESDDDLNGHGTHVAGTVGGRKFGVATDCNIISVKVLNGTGHGSVNAIVRGMMYKWEEILRRKTDTGEKRKVVVNMSLGVKGRSDEIEKYVSRVTREGAPVVPSAGNDQTDACLFTPAWMPLAITVWQVCVV